MTPLDDVEEEVDDEDDDDETEVPAPPAPPLPVELVVPIPPTPLLEVEPLDEEPLCGEGVPHAAALIRAKISPQKYS